MIRTIDMSVLIPRSLELQQTNQNSINARSDIKQETFSQMLQEKTVTELQQVTETNQSEQKQMINKDGRSGTGGENTKKRTKEEKEEKEEKKEKEAEINNQSVRPRRRNTYDSMLDIKV